jgi:hypothetical protein
MEFWPGETYQAFFEHLDLKGGFYYEVPELIARMLEDLCNSDYYSDSVGVHLSSALLHPYFLGGKIGMEQVHFFRDIGYRRDTFQSGHD